MSPAFQETLQGNELLLNSQGESFSDLHHVGDQAQAIVMNIGRQGRLEELAGSAYRSTFQREGAAVYSSCSY